MGRVTKNLYNLLVTQPACSLESFLRTGDRVIEVGVTEQTIADAVAKNDSVSYLGIAKTISPNWVSHQRVQWFATSSDLPGYKNNASCLFLSGNAVKHAWFPQRLQHPRIIAVEVVWWRPVFWLALIGITRSVLLHKWMYHGHIAFTSDSRRSFIIMSVVEPIHTGVRHYAPPQYSAQEIFSRLSQEEMTYALLRWFEADEINREISEDFDLLIADADYQRAQEFFMKQPGIVPFDIYTESGVGETQYLKLPYYPPRCARELLRNVEVINNIPRPNPKDYFYSLLYHVVFHKGFKSGLRSSYGQLKTEIDHDYEKRLTSAAEAAKIPTKNFATLEAAAEYLQSVGWHPSNDMLRKLSLSNEWIEIHYNLSSFDSADGNTPGLTVFIVREHAVKEGKLDMITNLITREGFEIIQQAELTGDQQTRAAVEIRGGNWGKGPWMKEGGGPAVVIVAFDLIPKVPSPYEKMRYPHLDNQRTLVKERIRNTYNARLKKSERCNILHASDNTAEAYEYIETIWDDSMVDVLQRKIADKQKTFVSVFPVRKNLTGSGRRAKIELIEYKGSLAIHKKFRPQSLRYLEREKYAYQELSAKIRHIPPCLDAGADYIILPVFEPSLQRLGLLPLKAVKAVYNVLESLFREGLFWGDATPQNVCFDKYGNVVCIDFEFLQRYQVQPATIQDGFDVGQTPQSSTYDFPGLRLRFEADTFEKIWTPVCGLTFEQISTPHSDVYYQTRRMLYFCQHIPAQFTIVLSKKIKRSLRSKIPILGKRVIRFIDTAIDRCLFKR